MKNKLRQIAAIARVSVLELYRRKDIYVAVILLMAVMVPLASVNVFGVEGIENYLSEITLLLIWLFSTLITVMTTARQIPSEIESRTVYPLLAKPVTRSTFVWGKYMGALAASCGTITIFYACFAIMAAIFSEGVVNTVFIQAFFFHLAFTALLSAFTMLGSVIMTKPANVTCSLLLAFFMVLFGKGLHSMLQATAWPLKGVVAFLHAFAPHFEFYDLRGLVTHNWPPLSVGVFCFALVYAVVYGVLVIAVTVKVLKRKRI